MTAIVPVPEPGHGDVSELEFRAYADDLLLSEGRGAAAEVVGRLAAELDARLPRPYAARAVRRTPGEWAVAARRVQAELVRLRLPPGLASVELALPPGGSPAIAVDGEPADADVDPAVAEALHELERRGHERFPAFLARADRVDEERWQLTIDPL